MKNADGQVWIKTLIDNTDAEKALKQTEKDIEKFGKDIDKNEAAKLPLEKQMQEYGVALDNAKAKLHELAEEQQRIAGIEAGTVQVTPEQAIEAFGRKEENIKELKAQQAEVDALQKKWDATADKVDEYNQKITEARAELTKGQEIAGQLTAKMTGAGEKTTKFAQASEEAQKKMQKLSKRIGGILKSALVFSVLYAGLNKLKNLISEYIKKDKELSAALAGLKAAWLTAFQPVWEVIQPALLALMRIMTAVARVIANVFSFFTGKSTKDMANNAKTLNTEKKALEGVGGAAAEAAKSLAGFDEINRLDAEKSAGGGGGSTGTGDVPLNFNAMNQIEKEFGELEVYISGALLALGAILAFSGANLPLGIGLMAAGAIGLATAMKPGWNSLPPKVQKAINTVLVVLGGAMLAVGAILAFSGANLPLGIGLMAAGALALGAAIGLNWNTLKEKMKGPLGDVVAMISLGLLALGAVLAFSGAALPLGIALLAAGALGLATTVGLNWHTMKEKLQGPWGELLGVISAGLLVLGILLCFTGAALPLGIALIAAGAAGLVTVGALNWGAILEKLKEVWKSIKEWWNTHVAHYFTLEYWQEKLSPITNAIQGIIEKLKEIRENRISGITAVSEYYKEQSGMQTYAAVRNVPALAAGAVIPPNQKFLAMLGDQKSGTNIETPLSTMVQAFKQALNEGGYRGNQTVVMEVDGREFGRVVLNAYNSESQRVGVSLGGV